MQVFGQRAGPGMLALVSQGSDALIDLTGELKNAEGTAQATADTMSGGLWGALKSIQSIVESAYISLGERFGPAIEKVAKAFAKFPAPIQEVVVVVGSLAGAMGGLMLIMPQSFGAIVQFPGKLLVLAKSLKGVTAAQWGLNAALAANPIGIVVAAVALLAGGLYLLFTKTEIGRQIFAAYANILKGVFATAVGLARFAIEKLSVAIKSAKIIFSAMIPPGMLKVLEYLANRVASVTEEVRDFNESLDKGAKQARITREALEELDGVTTLDDLAKTATRLVKEGKSSSKVMREIADRAIILQDEGDDLDKILQSIVDAYSDSAKSGAKAAKVTAKLAKEQEDAAEAAAELAEEQQAATRATDALNDRLKEQRRLLLGLPTDKAIQDFKALTRTWNELSKSGEVTAEVTERYTAILLDAAEAGLDLDEAQLALVESAKAAAAAQEAVAKALDAAEEEWDAITKAQNAAAEAAAKLAKEQAAIAASTDDATQAASGWSQALAAVAGEMGGAVQQSANLVLSMLEHNKAQKSAATAGQATTGQFGKMRVGAGLLATAFSAIGENMEGSEKETMDALSSLAQGFATGGKIGLIIAGAQLAAAAIVKMFSSSASYKAARKSWQDFHERIMEDLGNTAEFAREVQTAIDDGWKRSAAETRAAFILTGLAAGESYDAAFRAYEKYQRAIKSENQAAIKREEAFYDEWVKIAEDAAEELDRLFDAVTSAYDKVREAGEEAYDEVYRAAIASGVGQEEAAARATQAQINATQKVLEAEGRKYARIAAFEAALAAHRSGNADQMVEEAKAAAAETIAAWGAAVVAVTQADRAATDAMIGNGNELTTARAAGRSARKAGRAAARSERKAAREAEQAEELAAQEAALAEAQAVIEAALEAETTAREEALAAQQAAADKVFGSVISGYFRAKDAGVSAYETVYDAAIESGKKQSVAIALATQAQIDAKAEVLAAEGEKYAQLAAFEAALAAIRSGNADGAAQAAQDAAATSRLAWDTAMTAVGLADEIASDAMQGNSTATSDQAVSDAVGMSEGVRGAIDKVTEKNIASSDAIQSSNTKAADQALSESSRMVNGIVAEIDKIPTSRTVEIKYHGSQTGTHGGSGTGAPGRAHGGPVTGGRPYRVGERGPELFIPSQSGRIAPHGSSAGGGVDAKAFAQAVADALQDVKLEVDGRQLGRLTIRHQPTAVAELGGRR